MLTVNDYEHYARQHLPKKVLDYYQSGANDQFTLGENRSAFTRLRIRPRFLTKDLTLCSSACKLLGDQSATSPIAVAPTAMQRMAHPNGELATVKGKAD
jgi:(S)-2-hydroxy-acid oxidase